MTVFAAGVMVRPTLSLPLHGWPFVCLYESNCCTQPTVCSGLQLSWTHIIGLKAASAYGGGIPSMKTGCCRVVRLMPAAGAPAVVAVLLRPPLFPVAAEFVR
jgi:hypothetical protein